MFCGVGKSGSPAEKSITSIPDARIAVARELMAIVGDSLIRETRSASFIFLSLHQHEVSFSFAVLPVPEPDRAPLRQAYKFLLPSGSSRTCIVRQAPETESRFAVPACDSSTPSGIHNRNR